MVPQNWVYRQRFPFTPIQVWTLLSRMYFQKSVITMRDHQVIYRLYAYVERLGINSSLIRPHYELPITMVASSRKKKSRQGIRIRKNKQPVSIVESSSSHLNRTESSHSSNVRSASNMIPCFPANNSTDAHHCDIVLSCSSPSHFTKDSPFNNLLPKSEPGQLQKIKPLLGKSKRILFEK
jgi:hypothetical protein